MATINSLALLALKCAPNVFDLSSDMSHASIRDQIVRARLLARDLVGLPQPPKSVLVVGAGFAGISAALACAKAGIRVSVVDVNPRPFQLQTGVSDRWVGPFLYEWPSHRAHDQTYPPLATPSWIDDSILSEIWTQFAPGPDPIQADILAGHARDVLKNYLTSSPKPAGVLNIYVNPTISTEASFRSAVHSFVGEFAADRQRTLTLPRCRDWPEANAVAPSIDVNAVILGGGLGAERIALDPLPHPSASEPLVAGTPFWQNDGWLSAPASDRVGIFGAGDGALQDVLRALTGHRHPLETLRDIRMDPHVDQALGEAELELLGIEQEGRLSATWTQVNQDSKAQYHRGLVDDRTDRRCASVAQGLARNPGVRDAVQQVLQSGTGEVYHIFREVRFTKAYMLNRFVLHLIEACQDVYGPFPGKVRYVRSSGVRAMLGRNHGSGHRPAQFEVHVLDETGATLKDLWLDRVAVRFGPDPKGMPGHQMLGLSNAEIAERTSLGQVPYPFVADPMPW
ncbi:FAD-dependent oxidoreductase [Stenotrophomonas sp. PS02289]|uniref:NAD(P)-binding protein n=1 Tax=Stenotrophomonas sp. PS02289 TaxID=2991422 RepID=UPI002499DDB4|nr:FAD-dependent oxidoreductase [Stenotrophomonas sp. PS02289]